MDGKREQSGTLWAMGEKARGRWKSALQAQTDSYIEWIFRSFGLRVESVNELL